MPNVPTPCAVQAATLRPREMWTLLNMSKSGFYRAAAQVSSRKDSG